MGMGMDICAYDKYTLVREMWIEAYGHGQLVARVYGVGSIWDIYSCAWVQLARTTRVQTSYFLHQEQVMCDMYT